MANNIRYSPSKNLSKGIIDAVSKISVLDDDFLYEIDVLINNVSDTFTCGTEDKKPINTSVGEVNSARIKQISTKQNIKRQEFVAKLVEGFGKRDMDDKINDVSRAIKSETPKADTKISKVGGFVSTVQAKGKVSKLVGTATKDLKNARKLSPNTIVVVPEEDLVCKPTVMTDAVRSRELAKADLVADNLVADTMKSDIPISIPQTTKDQDNSYKKSLEKAADKAVSAALGSVVSTGTRASDILIDFKFSNKFIKKDSELSSVVSKISKVITTNKQFMDLVKQELDNIPKYLDDYFNTFAMMDFYFMSLLLRYRELNQQVNIDTYIAPFVSDITAALTDDVDRKSPIAIAVYEETISKINRYNGLISTLLPDGPSLDTLNVSSKKNQMRQIIDSNIKSLSDKGDVSLTNDVIIDFSVSSGDKVSGSLKSFLDVASRPPTVQEAKTNKYIENIYKETEAYYRTNMMKSSLVNIENNTKGAAQISYKLISYYSRLEPFLQKFLFYKNELIKHTKKLRDAYEFTYSEYNEQRIREQIAIVGAEVAQEFGGSSSASGNTGEDLAAAANDNTKYDEIQPPQAVADGVYTFQKEGDASIEQIKYWRYWSTVLNTVGLNPQYWSIGVILPSPSGAIRVPLPTFWIPLVVIPTPTAICVVWLTINGMVISPTIWMLNFAPISEGKSRHLSLFRGSNQNIKDATETKSLGSTVIGGIDQNPLVSLNEALVADDLPTPERMKASNFLWVKYLNSWHSSAKPFMGLP